MDSFELMKICHFPLLMESRMKRFLVLKYIEFIFVFYAYRHMYIVFMI